MKFFYRKDTITIINSLRTHAKQCDLISKKISQTNRQMKSDNTHEKHNTFYRRISYAATDGSKLKSASMTVEAAFALPLLIFCLVNMLFAIQVIETSGRMTAAMHETGNEICSYGYAKQKGLDEIPGVFSTLYAASSIAKHMGTAVERRGGIKGGIAGISYIKSSVMENGGIVDITTTYGLKYPVNMSLPTIILGNRYYGHAWVGYEGIGGKHNSGEEMDPIVYITPSGTVYHMTINCRHLNPKLMTVLLESVNSMRSNDGSKYYACELCGNKTTFGNVFITEYGNRYHSDINCSGIKRNVKAVHLSEVGGRRQCMTCGG